MNKKLLIPVIVLMVALLFVVISAVSAEPDQAAVINCTFDIVVDEWEDGIYWRGPVYECNHDGILDGRVEFHESETIPFNPLGKMAHFYEEFDFYPDSGGWIHGFNNGIWTFSNLNFRAQGKVTDASDEWAHLKGANYFETGTTSGGLDDPLPLEALGTSMRIVPAR